jgi:hypothetical protein
LFWGTNVRKKKLTTNDKDFNIQRFQDLRFHSGAWKEILNSIFFIRQIQIFSFALNIRWHLALASALP